jgi:hypothetical protein
MSRTKPKAGLEPIAFTAALAPAPGKALTLDSEGEARLTLILSQQDAQSLLKEWPRLQDTSFHVVFVPEGEVRK